MQLNKNTKEIIVYIVFVAILLFSSNLKQYAQSASEIKEITAVRTIGIDMLDNGKTLVTLVIKTTKNETYIDKQEGFTIFEAIRNAQKHTLKMPYWGHVDNILIGESAAKNGIMGYLDFFMREHQFKLDINVLIVRNLKASDFIEKTTSKEDFISDRLNVLQSANRAHSTSGDAKLKDVAIKLSQKLNGMFIPSIEVIEPDKKIQISTFAAFSYDKLNSYLSEDEARGLNLINENFGSSIIVAKDSGGNYVSLEIVKTSIKNTLSFDGEVPRMKFILDVKSAIGEYYGKQELTNDLINSFNLQQQEEIKRYIESIINFSKTNGIDGIGLFDAINYNAPKKITTSPSVFINYLKDIDIQTDINTKCERTFLILNPIGS